MRALPGRPVLAAVAAVVAAVPAGAQGGGVSGDPVVVVSDAPAWRGEPPWSVGRAPIVLIGDAFGAIELHDVTDALRLPDGRIVVANDGSKQLLAFSASGEQVWAAGREGQGPREFGRLMDLALQGEEILVWDTRNARLVRVSDTGEILGTEAFENPSTMFVGRYRLTGVLTDSTVLLHPAFWPIPAAGPEGPVLESSPNLIYTRDGRLLDSFGSTGVEQYRVSSGLPPTLLWHRRTRHAVHGGRLYTGDGTAWEVEVHGPGGELERVLRLSREREPVPAEQVRAFIERQIASIPPDFPEAARAEGIARLRASKVPDRKPAYGAIVVDRLGYIWLQEYRHLRQYALPGPRRWTVLDPDGRWLGELVLPDMEVREIGEDWILGWRLDELGVEQIVLYALQRSGG